MELTVCAHVASGGRRRTSRYVADSGTTVEIFHESGALLPLQSDTPLDGHVLAQLLHIMNTGESVRVRGALSISAMRNIDELQRVWSRWRPSVYRHVEIMPDRIVTSPPRDTGRAISAFSGGADATFTALFHSGHQNPRRYPLTDVMMVHGFDIDLDKPKFFNALQQRVQPLVNELGLNMITLRTNSKDWKRQNWNDSHVLELAACMHMLAGDFAFGLIGSAEPYEALVLPWGSNPLTDPLASGGGLQIIHDGAGYSRTEKVALIAEHPTARRTVKVCWAGEEQHDNCGRCEKCVRTMLNFIAAGYPIPPAFPSGLNLEDITRMKIYTVPQKSELEDVLRHAQARGIDADWMPLLRRRLNRPLTRYEHGAPHRLASKTLDALGLKEPLKNYMAKQKTAKK